MKFRAASKSGVAKMEYMQKKRKYPVCRKKLYIAYIICEFWALHIPNMLFWNISLFNSVENGLKNNTRRELGDLMGGGGMESPPPRCKDTAPACRVNTGLVGAWEVEGCRAPHWCQCTASAGRVRMGGLGQRLKCTALAHGIKSHCLNKTKGHIWQGLITDLGES